CVTQRLDEQSAQVSECAPRGGGITVGELRDEVQRVEEEMRVQLQRQDMQPRAGEQGLESGRRKLRRARAAYTFGGPQRPDDRRVHEQIRIEAADEPEGEGD